MMRIQEAITHLKKYIIEIQKTSFDGSLTISRIDFIQRELDKFNSQYNINDYFNQRVDNLSAPIELQALIYFATGEDEKAETLLIEAQNYLLQNESFISTAAQKWLADKYTENQPTKVPIEGFLTLYAIGFFLTPILLMYDLISGLSQKRTFDSEFSSYPDLLSSFSGYITAAIVFDVTTLLLISLLAYCFYQRYEITRAFAILFHIYIVIFGIALMLMLENILTKYNIDSSGQQSSILTVFAFIWPFYWFFSKRVKRTFSRPMKIGRMEVT